MPEDALGIQTDGNFRLRASDDLATGTGFLRLPLFASQTDYLLFQAEGTFGHDFDSDKSFGVGALGLIYRQAIDPANAWGINGFIDLGGQNGFAGQASLGVEFEHLGGRGTSYRFGANAYLPFQDYTQDLDRALAPRLGFDSYVGIGQDHGPHRLEGFVTGFYYDSTSAAKALYGVTGELEYRFAGFTALPQGSHLYASLSLRYDSRDDGLSPLFGLGFTLALQDDPAHERVAELRRNIGFGSAFVPIEHTALANCMDGLPPPNADVVANPVLTDSDGDLGELFDTATFPTLVDITGPAAIDAACASDAECIAILSSTASSSVRPPAPFVVEIDRAVLTKSRGQCNWELSFIIVSG